MAYAEIGSITVKEMVQACEQVPELDYFISRDENGVYLHTGV